MGPAHNRSYNQPVGTILTRHLAAPLVRIKIRTVGQLENIGREVLEEKLGASLTNQIAIACEQRGVRLHYEKIEVLNEPTPAKAKPSPVTALPRMSKKRGRKPLRNPVEKSITSLKLDQVKIVGPLHQLAIWRISQLIRCSDQWLTKEARLSKQQVGTIDEKLAELGLSRQQSPVEPNTTSPSPR